MKAIETINKKLLLDQDKKTLSRLLANAIRADTEDYPEEITDILIFIGKGIAGNEKFYLEAKRLQERIEKELLLWSNAGPQEERDKARQEEALWSAYWSAYLYRYGTGPMANSMKICRLAQVARLLGSKEAKRVVAFYLSLDRYKHRHHSIKCLLENIGEIHAQFKKTKRGQAMKQKRIKSKRQESLDVVCKKHGLPDLEVGALCEAWRRPAVVVGGNDLGYLDVLIDGSKYLSSCDPTYCTRIFDIYGNVQYESDDLVGERGGISHERM